MTKTGLEGNPSFRTSGDYGRIRAVIPTKSQLTWRLIELARNNHERNH